MRKHRVAYLLLLSLSVFLSTLSFSPVFAQQAASEQASINVAGLRESVTVRRDERGIAYIEAANEADLYFAQGYVTASDRLWQMDAMRRAARGELSEIFGRAVLEQDKQHRAYGFAQLSEAIFAQLSGGTRAALEAYARGVNAYIESRTQKQLPPEFQILQYSPRPWMPADSLVIGKIFSEMLSSSWETDVMRAAFADLPAEKRERLFVETSPLDVLVVGKEAEKKAAQPAGDPLVSYSMDKSIALLRSLAEVKEARERAFERVGLVMLNHAASNNFVVSGKRTLSGKAMLANDPHLPPLVPSIWHMVHLAMPGMRVSGVTAPGAPGIILGHNENIAWGATNLGPDVQDLYLEKFDKENTRKYMTPQGWREAEVRREEIKVRKGFTDTATDTEIFEVTVTRHGPVIFEKDGARYALRWTALEPKSIEFSAFYGINRARNWTEFRAALQSYEGPTQNFVYADKEGHIGYYGAGRIPIRKSGDGSVPYDGATDAGEWTGYIPFDELPHVYDPPEGFIVTANQRIAGKGYTHFLTHDWAAPFRARRIHDLLQANPKLKPEDIRDIQADTFHIGLSSFTREAIKLQGETNGTASAPSDAKWRETLQLFGAWDGRLSTDSRVAPLAGEMRTAFRRRILEAALGAERAKQFEWDNEATFLDRIITERPPAWLPAGFKNYLELLRACEADARAALTKRLGEDEAKWTWGNYRQITLRHPLAGVPLIGNQFAIAPFPQNGGGNVVNVGASVSMRFIAIPAEWDATRQGIALGESGDPSSTHFKDQLEDWRNVTPRLFPFTKDAVEKAAKETFTLMPAK